jgi:multicomponent Na+:H+ antiporter subunit D
MRGLVRGVTDLFAAVDRAVVTASSAAINAANDPYGAVRGPLSALLGRDREAIRDGSLRASIAASVLLVVAVLGATLIGLL